MIGKRVQQLRLEKGISLSELAERAGVAKSYLSTLERDIQANPSIQFLEKISSVLGVDIETLIRLESKIDHDKIDNDWLDLAREAADSGISKEQFREFLEFNKWRLNQTEE